MAAIANGGTGQTTAAAALSALGAYASSNPSGYQTAAQVSTAITIYGSVVYQGVWNASTNTPTLASGVGTKGFEYKVSVAGATLIDGVNQWNVGDFITFNGLTWDKTDGLPSEVLSVAGRAGAVVLTHADVSGAAASGANSDITSLSGLTTALSIAQGGTGAASVSTAPTWNQNTTGNAATASAIPYSGLTGTVPTWNQNTTGTASNITGIAAPANGGTGIANNAASTLAISGAYASTFTVSGAYTYTFPGASHTLAGLGAMQSWTGTQTFNGTSATEALKVLNAAETAHIVSAAPAATQTFYVASGAVQYYTTAAANNWTLNVAFSAGTALNTAMAVGDSITIALMTTQGATAYYQSALQIDGVAVTPKWQGGTAPAAGNASGIDAYSITIVKTAASVYTAMAALTQYK